MLDVKKLFEKMEIDAERNIERKAKKKANYRNEIEAERRIIRKYESNVDATKLEIAAARNCA